MRGKWWKRQRRFLALLGKEKQTTPGNWISHFVNEIWMCLQLACSGLVNSFTQQDRPKEFSQKGVGIKFSAKMAWFWHSLSKRHGREARQTSKPQNRLKSFFWYWTVPHRAQIICLNPINITHLGCTSQLSYPHYMIASLCENTMSSVTVTVHKLIWTRTKT